MTKEEPTIYYLKNEDILNTDILYNYIYPNMSSNYYWSDDFSEEFYIHAAHAGFITVSNFFDNQLLLLPELQFEYALLDFENLHISKKVKKLIQQDDYELSINKNFKTLLNEIEQYHEIPWLTDKYLDLVLKLKEFHHDTIDFQILSVELTCKKTKKIIAGELGYKIGSTYTSLTGFHNREKKYNNCGTLQLVLFALYLEECNCSFWNLGHASMDYKQKLGAKVYSREDFLKRWIVEAKK